MLQLADIDRLTVNNFEAFEEKSFATAKLSTNKYETVLGVVEFWKKGEVGWKSLSDDEIIEKLKNF